MWMWRVMLMVVVALAGLAWGQLGQAAAAGEKGPRAVYVAQDGARLSADFDNDARTVTVTLPGGKKVTLPQAPSASGARYSNGKETFWEHHGEGSFWEGEKLIFQGQVQNPEKGGKGAMKSERYERGWKKLAEIDGEQGEKVVAALKDIAPEFADLLIEYPFGDVYSRPGLDLKSREIATVAALTALGNARPQLKVHIHGALNVGCTKQEIIEVMIQMSVYAGFPAALNGLFAAQEVFTERGIK